MTVAAFVSVLAAVVELAIAAMALGVAGAPGWVGARRFAFLAATAAVYSISNVPQTLTVDPRLIVPASQLSLAAAALHVLGWLVASAAHGDPPPAPRRLDRTLRALLIAVAAAAAVPGALAGPGVHVHEVPWLAVRYATADATAAGSASFLVILLAPALVVARYLGGAAAGVPLSRTHLAGLLVLVVTGAWEVLVASQRASGPYLMDFGFLAATLTIGVALSRRARLDAARLADLVTGLERTVSDRTTELAQAHQALADAERLAAVGRLAAGVAHEVNSPLSSILSNASQLEAELRASALHGSSPELEEIARDIRAAATRIRDVVVDLKTFGVGPDRDGETRAAVRPIVETALRILRHELAEVAPVPVEDGDVPPVAANPGRLAQVLVNLLANAVEALPPERRRPGAVRVRVRREGAEVAIEVADAGRGIAASDRPRIFEPFYSTRAGASGLGLAVSHGLVRAMAGRIELESREGEGTVMRVFLPVARSGDPDPAEEPRPERRGEDRPTMPR